MPSKKHCIYKLNCLHESSSLSRRQKEKDVGDEHKEIDDFDALLIRGQQEIRSLIYTTRTRGGDDLTTTTTSSSLRDQTVAVDWKLVMERASRLELQKQAMLKDIKERARQRKLKQEKEKIDSKQERCRQQRQEKEQGRQRQHDRRRRSHSRRRRTSSGRNRRSKSCFSRMKIVQSCNKEGDSEYNGSDDDEMKVRLLPNNINKCTTTRTKTRDSWNEIDDVTDYYYSSSSLPHQNRIDNVRAGGGGIKDTASTTRTRRTKSQPRQRRPQQTPRRSRRYQEQWTRFHDSSNYFLEDETRTSLCRGTSTTEFEESTTTATATMTLITRAEF